MTEYKDPLSGKIVKFDLVDTEQIEIPSYQRTVSNSLSSKILNSMLSTGYFTAPVLLAKVDGKLYVVDGQHRLLAARAAALPKIPALIVEDRTILDQILYMNTERPPNIKERSQQAVKIYDDYVQREPNLKEELLAGFIEHPMLVTFGMALRKDPDFSASAVEQVAKWDKFLPKPLSKASKNRELYADALIDLLKVVSQKETQLVGEGLKEHQFLKKMIVSKANPYKRKSRNAVPPEFLTVIRTVKENVEKLQVEDFLAVEE